MPSEKSFDVSAERFRTFFHELTERFVEREAVLEQVALGLLSREHCLLTGPPGTAKSGIGASVLGRILDEETGGPSLYAKQFTESTVQTDLVGPIDFKTLMQTGRTEHFTDQGMLGAVHAFIDEVLDGRDMLLRTTLNLLHERELKEGTQIRRGRIECAVMTTNRYLAEVLESSRESLLAFVDRIAFVSFVPKGFATKGAMGAVLRSQVGGVRAPELRSLLTIQDIDVLQDHVDGVFLDDALCGYLEALLASLDLELANAVRADPTFVPTRYLSTRTAVRCGKILRAACVLDHIVGQKRESLEVQVKDFERLKLTLLLSGPPLAHIETLLAKETDPRERRQLAIMRTEAEIWERVIAKTPKPEKIASRPRASFDLRALRTTAGVAAASSEAQTVIATAKELVKVADSAAVESRDAKDALDGMLSVYVERAVRAGLLAGAGEGGELHDVVYELSSTAEALEKMSAHSRPLARWLRGRAVRMLDDTMTFANFASELPKPGGTSLATHEAAAGELLTRLEALVERRTTLLSAGADEPASSAQSVKRAVARVTAEIADLMDRGFLYSASNLRASGTDLGSLLSALAPMIESLGRLGDRLTALGGEPDALKARVLGPRIEPLFVAALEGASDQDRSEFAEQVGTLIDRLREAGMGRALESRQVLALVGDALARKEQARVPRGPFAPDLEGYRSLRRSERRTSLAYTMVIIASRLDGPSLPTDAPERALPELIGRVAQLSPEAIQRLAALDLARVDRALTVLEAFWGRLAGAIDAGVGAGDESVLATYDAVARSGFFGLLRDESTLTRFCSEVRLAEDVWALPRSDAERVLARIGALEDSASKAFEALRRLQADAAWRAASAS